MSHAIIAQKLVPVLRFQEFSEDWCAKKINEVFSIGAGGDIDKSRLSKTQSDEFPYPVFANAETRKGLYGYASYFKEEGECVTVSGRGNLGTPHARHESFVPIVRLLVLRPLAESDVNFFEKVLRTTRFFVESTGVPQLTGPQIGGYCISFPTLPEQRKIADFLTAVDGRIGQLIQKKALLEDYKKGVMQQLFTQAIRFKDDHGNDFPEWDTIAMGQLYPQIRNGFVGTATPFYCDEGVQYVQGRNIKAGKIKDNGFVSITEAFHKKCSKSQLRTNDILMVQSGHVGECAVVTQTFDDSNCHALLVLTPRDGDVDSRFYVSYFYSSRGRRHIYKIKTGNTIAHILSSDLKKEAVPYPSPDEQTKIADFLSAIDRKIESVATQITETRTFKRGLLQQMFV